MTFHGQWANWPIRMAAAAAMAVPMVAAALAPAQAQKNVRLTVISGNNHNYAPVGAAIKSLMPKVDEILARTGNYKVSWVQGFGGTVVKVRGELDGVEAGLGDLGVVPGPFYQDKLSLYQIGYVTPFTTLDVQVATDGMLKLMDTFPEMRKQPERFNQKIVSITGTADNYLLWTKTKVTKFEDLKGMKISAVGSNIPWITAAGATPVTLKGLATVYNSLKTGVYEGTVLWQQVMAGFKFCELTPYKLDTSFGAVANATLMANSDSWASMPREVQAAITEAGATWSTAANKAILGGAKWGQNVCDTKYNQQTTALTAEEKRRWAFAIPNVAKAWAERQDKAGLPGTKMVSAWMDFMRDKKQLVTRNWDKE
jgi:TRAP-type C4-dicarboxylate transport system substrate-binding protein